jgi:hypothetical protein
VSFLLQGPSAAAQLITYCTHRCREGAQRILEEMFRECCDDVQQWTWIETWTWSFQASASTETKQSLPVLTHPMQTVHCYHIAMTMYLLQVQRASVCLHGKCRQVLKAQAAFYLHLPDEVTGCNHSTWDAEAEGPQIQG